MRPGRTESHPKGRVKLAVAGCLAMRDFSGQSPAEGRGGPFPTSHWTLGGGATWPGWGQGSRPSLVSRCPSLHPGSLCHSRPRRECVYGSRGAFPLGQQLIQVSSALAPHTVEAPPPCLREDTAQLHLPNRPPSWPAPTGSPCLRTGFWVQHGMCLVGVPWWGCRDSAGTPPMAPETHRTGLPHVTWGRCLQDQV